MKKEIPYFKQPDNTHCFQACLKMVLKYFFPEKEFTFEELDKITDKPKDKWTWSCTALVELKNIGLKIKQMENLQMSGLKPMVNQICIFYMVIRTLIQQVMALQRLNSSKISQEAKLS